MGKLRTDYAALGELGTNCYLLSNKDTNELIVIDPAAAADSVAKWALANEKKTVAILLTHGHFDHMAAAKELSILLGAPIYAAEAERELLKDPALNLSGKWMSRPVSLAADEWLRDGDVLQLAGFSVNVMATPGHTKGSLSFYIPEEKVLFAGDTLFAQSYGRVDFPTSSMSDMTYSIQEKLLPLPADTLVYPGHGSMTDIGTERAYNPLSNRQDY